MVITALLGNLEVLEVLWMDIDEEGSVGAGDRSDLVETGSGSGADSLVDSCLSSDSETSEEVWVEAGGISRVGSGLTGDLGSLMEVTVEVGVLLGLLRLGRTLKRFLLLDKALVDALWPATSAVFTLRSDLLVASPLWFSELLFVSTAGTEEAALTSVTTS